MKKVQLIGGFDFVKESLCTLINSADIDMQATAESIDFEDLKNHKVASIILDISVLNNALEIVADIRQISPGMPILIINGIEQADHAANFIRQGCNGYLSSQCKYEHIIEGINAITSGLEYIRPTYLYEKIKDILNNANVQDRLSKRELQVFLKLAQGKSNLTVAGELNISRSTVSVFKSKIFKKLHINNSAELIVYALNHHCLAQSFPVIYATAGEL